MSRSGSPIPAGGGTRPRAFGATRRAGLVALLAGGLLAGCAVPPPEAYVASAGGIGARSTPAGADARGDACISQAGRAPALDLPVAAATEVYCGGWTQPSARVFALRGTVELDQFVGGGVWWQWLDERVTCGAVEPTRLADGTPARLLRCNRRQGGWPHLAVVTSGAEGVVVADGIPSALPVIERIARGIPAPAVDAAAARSDALQLEAVRVSVRAFGSNDIRDYDRAMVLGQELNLAEDYAGAETAYRAALAIQERVIGAGNANTVAPLLLLAMNLSNQQRFREAEALYARAERLAPEAADPTGPARVLHYRGLHALNQGQLPRAAELLARADAAFLPLVPASLTAPRSPGLESAAIADLASPIAQGAVLGLAEVRRARATVAARTGRGEEAVALAGDARSLLSRVNFDRNAIAGRALRTQAAAFSAAQDPRRAGDLLEAAAQRFGQSAPGQQRSEARTLFLAGQRRLEAGRQDVALTSFRAGAAILRERRLSLEPELVLAYLDALSAQLAREPANAQALGREIFAAVQFAQRGQTVRFVSQSAARLAAGGGDSRAAGAVRRMQDVERELRELFAERDALPAGAPAAMRGALDERIDARLRERDEAESEAAAAAPGYRQLLLGAVGVEDAARVLGPREVMVQILLGARHGYALAVRADGGVAARRIELGEAAAGALVARMRAGLDQPAQGPRPFDAAAAHELYGRIFGPLAAAMEGADKLTVIPDGPLLAIPFGMLLAEPAQEGRLGEAAWLVRRHAVVHATSAQAVVTLRAGSPASAAPRAYLGFGDFEPPNAGQLARTFPADRCAEDARLAAGLGRLPGSREEVRFAARFAGGDARATAFGAEFTLDGLRRADLGSARILHLATHALLPGELSCVQEPSIVVSPARGAVDAASAFLRSSEVLNMRLDADLVILSACNTAGPATGVGSAGSAGEALSGLARSFMYAGARGLLVTHWPAVDLAAAFAVADMMRRQAEGADSAAALRAAQETMIQEAGRGLPAEFSHPYYWAGFALIGDGRRAPARLAGAPAAAGAM